MPLWLRRTIYLSFITLFLIVAPILTLYSMGYRYQWQKHRLERTGLLIVSGEPTDARVIIDGVERARGLPARIGGLGVNAYDVRIERAGYLAINKRVIIGSGQTSFITDAILFRVSEPMLVSAGGITDFTVSADGAWAAYAHTANAADEVWLLNLRTAQRTLALRITRKPSRVHETIRMQTLTLSWTPRNAHLLVTGTSDGSAFAITPGSPLNIQSLRGKFSRSPEAFQWELGDAPVLIATVGNHLERLSLTTGRVALLTVPVPRRPFGVSRQRLFVSDGTNIVMAPIAGGPSQVLAPLPPGATVTSFDDLNDATLTIRTNHPDTIITIGTATRTVAIREGHDTYRALRDPRAIIWQRAPAEVWMEHDNPPHTHLLTRSAEPIVRAIWHPNGHYAITATARDIVAIELDERNGWSTTTLGVFDVVRDLASTIDGAILFIAGRRGTVDGLWSIQLR